MANSFFYLCSAWLAAAAVSGSSTVGQIIFFDLVAVGLEQHRGPAQLTDLLFGPFDHAVTLARLLVKDHPACRHFEALFGARFGLKLGHLALLCGGRQRGPADGFDALVSVLIHRRHGSPFWPGGGEAALWQRPPRNTTQTRINRLNRVRPLELAAPSNMERERSRPFLVAHAQDAVHGPAPITSAPAPSPLGDLRSVVPARP